MMKLTKREKELLRVIGKLQDLVGNAKNAYDNDRSRDRAEKVQKPLEEAFELAVSTRSQYPIVE
jgi:hypothetical protein